MLNIQLQKSCPPLCFGFAFGVLADSALLSMQDKNIDGGLKCFLTKCLWQLNMVLENAPLGASKVVPYK